MESKSDTFLYIDQLKGLAIILVVYGHFFAFSYHNLLGMHDFIYSFHMPLFMYLSGFLAFNFEKKVSWGKFFKRKVINLLIPFFSVGILFSFFRYNNCYNFFTSALHNGYWYLWTLFCLLVIIYIWASLTEKKSLSIQILSALAIYAFLFIIHKLTENHLFHQIFSLREISHYFPYVILGTLVRNREKVTKCFTSNITYCLAFAFFLVYVCIQVIENQSQLLDIQLVNIFLRGGGGNVILCYNYSKFIFYEI